MCIRKCKFTTSAICYKKKKPLLKRNDSNKNDLIQNKPIVNNPVEDVFQYSYLLLDV